MHTSMKRYAKFFNECNVLTGSIFAYGQTSSGKTYTMTGITEFAVADIFDYIFQVHASLHQLMLLSILLMHY